MQRLLKESRHHDLRGNVSLKVDELRKEANILSERQIISMVKEYFAVDPAAGMLYSWEDIMTCNNQGGTEKDKDADFSSISDFAHRWDRIVNGLPNRPDDDHLRFYFIREIRKSHPMRKEVEKFAEAEEHDEERSYKLLHRQMWKRINH